MHVTPDEFRDEIAVLGEIVADIGKIASNIIQGARQSGSLTYLEKCGFEKLISEMYERVEKFDDQHRDIMDFKLK